MTVADTLAERAKTYGDFKDIATISQNLQKVMRTGRNWDALPNDMREALQAIASKMARILNGDPEHIDSWHDIAGYAQLPENRLRQAAAAEVATPVPPSAMPPEDIDVQYAPHTSVADQPWRGRRRSWPHGADWVRGATRDDVVAAVQRMG